MNLEAYRIVGELVAGALFLMNCYLLYLFTWKAWKRHGKSFRSWRSKPTFLSATALALYFLGAMGLRAWDWALMIATNLNIQYDYPPAEVMLWLLSRSWPLVIIFGALTLTGGVVIATVFAPEAEEKIKGYRVYVMSWVCLISVVLPVSIFLILHGWP